MSVPVSIFRVDPRTQTIKPMVIAVSVRTVAKLIGTVSKKLGWRKLLENPQGQTQHLMVASRCDIPVHVRMQEWRIRGGPNTAGVGLLFGTYQGKTEGMWHCPVDLAWLERNIVWAKADDPAAAAEVLEAEEHHAREREEAETAQLAQAPSTAAEAIAALAGEEGRGAAVPLPGLPAAGPKVGLSGMADEPPAADGSADR